MQEQQTHTEGTEWDAEAERELQVPIERAPAAQFMCFLINVPSYLGLTCASLLFATRRALAKGLQGRPGIVYVFKWPRLPRLGPSFPLFILVGSGWGGGPLMTSKWAHSSVLTTRPCFQGTIHHPCVVRLCLRPTS